MALTGQQTHIAQLLYHLAIQRGISPAHAREFVNAAYQESGLNPGINNRAGSGAAGLFQLLSGGYRQKAQQLGGLYNPRANALAILPDYQRYWQQHPHARPGEAGAAVERSGQGPGFYSRHLGFFNQLGGGVAPPIPSVGGPGSGLAAAPDPSMFTQALQAQIGHAPNVQALTDALRQGIPQAQPLGVPQPGAPPAQPRQTRLGQVKLGAGADRPGVRTSGAVLQFVRRLAGLAGHALTIGTGTNHSEMTVNGHVSDHWSGHAADIPATGAELLRLGRLALIAAGANPAWAMRQHGGLYNVHGHQVIFLTNEGGNHFNHLHVSAR